jgi:hypothetical protein
MIIFTCVRAVLFLSEGKRISVKSSSPELLKAEARLNSIQYIIPYRKESTTLHYKDQLVNAV